MTAKLRRLAPYILREWRTLTVILLLTALAAALAAIQPWPLKLLVDHALGGADPPPALSVALHAIPLDASVPVLIVVAAVASLVVFVVSSVVDLGLNWAWASAGQRMVYSLGAALFRRMQRLSLGFHRRASTGDLLDRLTADTYCTYAMADALLVSPARHVLAIAAIIGVAWRLDPQLAGVSLAAAPLLGGSAVLFGRMLTHRARRKRQAEARLLRFVHQTLSAIPVVQAFCSETQNRRRFELLAEDAVVRSQRSTFARNTYQLVNGLTLSLGAALVLLVGGLRVLSGSMSVGSLLVFVAYLRTMQGAFRGLLTTFGEVKQAEASADRVLEVLEADDELPEAPNAAVPLPRSAGERGHVQIENVTFGHEPGRPVLREVSIEARPGETVALVGPTGAGKTTLVSLIPRFFDPEAGRVLLDGIDLRKAQLASVRQQVSLVLQEPMLLPTTVAENIAYGRPDATRDEVIAASRAAGADEFIRGLPDGYDSIIGQEGATLSGGQRQRVAIARAFLKDAPVLILDEPTSALDAETEEALLESLQRLMAGRTTFVIAHRLSTTRHADRIVVLENGMVVETGAQDELLAAGGLYHHLHTRQQLAGVPEVAR